MTGDPNYFPNYEDEEIGEEESDDASLVGNEPVIGGVAVTKGMCLIMITMKIMCSKMCLINGRGIFKSSEPEHENQYKNKQTRCLKLQNAGVE